MTVKAQHPEDEHPNSQTKARKRLMAEARLISFGVSLSGSMALTSGLLGFQFAANRFRLFTARGPHASMTANRSSPRRPVHFEHFASRWFRAAVASGCYGALFL